jgi:hypothetical protein
MAKSVASASKKKRTRTQKVMNKELVDHYVARLVDALGNDRNFAAVFADLKFDQHLNLEDLVAVASKFTSPLAASSSRSKALERILTRHTNLMSVKLKQRAVGGRSAA